MDGPIIRPATEQDIDALVPLYADFHEFHVHGVPDRLRLPDTPDEIPLRTALREILRRTDAQIFIADFENKLIGFAEIYLRLDEPHPLRVPHRYGYLQCLLISEPFRKSGLGKQLISSAHQWAKEQQATEVHLDVWEFADGPLHFYEKLGYRTLKRHLVTDLLREDLAAQHKARPGENREYNAGKR
jgi:ribosomal protein S18 acetylase RimI-like enzyme